MLALPYFKPMPSFLRIQLTSRTTSMCAVFLPLLHSGIDFGSPQPHDPLLCQSAVNCLCNAEHPCHPLHVGLFRTGPPCKCRLCRIPLLIHRRHLSIWVMWSMGSRRQIHTSFSASERFLARSSTVIRLVNSVACEIAV